MTDNDPKARIETLEIRLAHQEVALEELTRTLLRQERQMREHAEILERLELQVRALAPADGGASPADEKPPHY